MESKKRVTVARTVVGILNHLPYHYSWRKISHAERQRQSHRGAYRNESPKMVHAESNKLTPNSSNAQPGATVSSIDCTQTRKACRGVLSCRRCSRSTPKNHSVINNEKGARTPVPCATQQHTTSTPRRPLTLNSADRLEGIPRYIQSDDQRAKHPPDYHPVLSCTRAAGTSSRDTMAVSRTRSSGV